MSKSGTWLKWWICTRKGSIRRASRDYQNGFAVAGAAVVLLERAKAASHAGKNPEGVFTTTIDELCTDHFTDEEVVRGVLESLQQQRWITLGKTDVKTVDIDTDFTVRVVSFLEFNDPLGSAAERKRVHRERKKMFVNSREMEQVPRNGTRCEQELELELELEEEKNPPFPPVPHINILDKKTGGGGKQKSEGKLTQFRSRTEAKLGEVMATGASSVAEALMLKVDRPVKKKRYQVEAWNRAIDNFVDAVKAGKEFSGDPTGYILSTLPSFEIAREAPQMKRFAKKDDALPKQRTHEEFMADMLKDTGYIDGVK